MEQSDAALKQPTAQESGSEATSEDGSELESDCPSADDEPQQQPNAVVQRKQVGEINETAAGNQKRDTLNVIPQTPIKNQRLTTGKSILTRDVKRGKGNAEGGMKKRAWEYSNPIKKEVVDMGRLFAQKYFQL